MMMESKTTLTFGNNTSAHVYQCMIPGTNEKKNRILSNGITIMMLCNLYFGKKLNQHVSQFFKFISACGGPKNI